ncbi:MAG: chaperone NapD [Sutterella wadsworthensis]
MNYSSVVITLAAGAEDRALEALTALEGLEVHHVDETSRRVVAVIEAETTGLEADVFERIRRTEGVIDVSLHAHYFEDEATAE